MKMEIGLTETASGPRAFFQIEGFEKFLIEGSAGVRIQTTNHNKLRIVVNDMEVLETMLDALPLRREDEN